MPYRSNAELPKGVLSALPGEAQTIFRRAYNNIASKNPDHSEARMQRMAWGAVRNAGWHEPDGDDDKAKWSHDEDDVDVADGEEISIRETLVLDDGADVRMTNDGYLTAMPRVARVGVQLYRGSEFGKPSVDVVRVYRPPDEVFATDAMKSYAHRPVTDDHPPVLVTAANWKKYARGQTGDEVLRDGEFVRVPMVLMDKAMIAGVQDGKRELSQGYTMFVDWTPGETPDGDEYDAVARDMRMNHLAVVKAARGGPELRIGDYQPGERQMANDSASLRTITVDELPVQVADSNSAAIVSRYIDKTSKEIENLKRKLAEAEEEEKKRKTKDEATIATRDAAVATKDAEIAALRKQVEDGKVTPDALDLMVKDRASVIAKAKVLMADKQVAVDGKSVAEIRKQVVDAKLGEVAAKYTDAQYTSAFDSFAAGVQVDDQQAGGSGDPIRNAFMQPARDTRGNFYDERDRKLEERWKQTKTA